MDPVAIQMRTHLKYLPYINQCNDTACYVFVIIQIGTINLSSLHYLLNETLDFIVLCKFSALLAISVYIL